MAQHVVPSGKHWAVRRSGSVRASRRYTKKSDALKRAVALALRQGSVVYIHHRDGRLKEVLLRP